MQIMGLDLGIMTLCRSWGLIWVSRRYTDAGARFGFQDVMETYQREHGGGRWSEVCLGLNQIVGMFRTTRINRLAEVATEVA